MPPPPIECRHDCVILWPQGFCRHNQTNKYFDFYLIKRSLLGWTWLNQVVCLKMKRFKPWVRFSSWSWRHKVPFCREDHTMGNWVASRSWEQLLANSKQEEWEPQSYNSKELNSAKSHVILKEDPKLKENSLANTSMSAWLNPEQKIQLYHAKTSDLQNCEMINLSCFKPSFLYTVEIRYRTIYMPKWNPEVE